MSLYFSYESRDTITSFLKLSVAVKAITRLNLEHIDKLDIKIKKKNQPSWFTFSRQRKIWSSHVVVLQRTAKKYTKNYNALAQPLFSSLNHLFSLVVIAVAVVVF